MKLQTEISPSGEDKIIIKCKEYTEEVKQIERLISNIIRGSGELKLYLLNTEYYIPISQIQFFETSGNKVAAHTDGNMYYTELKLFELEQLMPTAFVRVSKSAIVNTRAVASITRALTGGGEIEFKNGNKKLYFSRNYYKILKQRIEETRLIRGMEYEV